MKQRYFLSQSTVRGLLVVTLAFLLAGAGSFALPTQSAWAQDFDDIADEIEEIRSLPPTYEESFRADDGTWDVDLDLETSHVTIASSNYRVTVIEEQTFYWGTSAQTADDLLVEVDVYRVAGPLDNEFGLVVRHEDVTDFYALLASSDGYYRIQKQVDDTWADIVPWTLTDLVDQTEGAVNRIGVYANGTTLALLINGEIADVVEDDSFASGEIGLAAGSYGEGGVEVTFDDLTLWDLNNLGEPLVLPVVTTTAEPAETPEATVAPEEEPTAESTVELTAEPTADISGEPTAEPLLKPTAEATSEPVDEPTVEPTVEATDAPVEEPTPEATPEAAETPVAVDMDVTALVDAIRNSDVAVTDDFRRDEGLWSLPEGDAATAVIASREMSIDVHDPNWMAWANLESINAADFLVEVDATQTAGPLAAEFGILFHYQDTDNFSFFAVDADGGWSFWIMQEGEWQEALPWAQSDAFDLGLNSTNRLGVLADQGLLTFLVNGEAVGQYEGEANVGGGIALTFGTFDEAGVAGTFDNFDLWVQTEGPEIVEVATPAADLQVGEDRSEDIAVITESDATYTTDFRRDDGAWAAAVDEDVEHFNQSRTLRIAIDREQWTTWSQQQDLTVDDFFAEVDGERILGPVVGEYGIVFRVVDDTNFYAFYISGNGYWSVYNQIDGAWNTLVDWTANPALDFSEGAVNRLGVLAEGSLLTFFINGEQVGQVEDDTFDSGGIGLTAGTFEEPGLEVAFDNFSLWTLEQ